MAVGHGDKFHDGGFHGGKSHSNKSHGGKSHGGAEQLFPALLFFIFLLCTIFTILIGSRVYENIRERDNASFHTDTALAYMTNKVRQGDEAEAVSIREENGCQILVLTSDYDGVLFETWIYQMDGALWELFTQKDSGLDVSSGQMIMECESVSFALETDEHGISLLTITLDGTREAKIALRTPQSHSKNQITTDTTAKVSLEIPSTSDLASNTAAQKGDTTS